MCRRRCWGGAGVGLVGVRWGVIVHLNGRLVPLGEASISPLDRGFIFGEGVYEGMRSVASSGGARIIGAAQHARRMRRGLEAAGLTWDTSRLEALSVEMVQANGCPDALVYWQVTGGAPEVRAGHSPRSRVAPGGLEPTAFAYCTPLPGLEAVLAAGVPVKRVIARPDPRWSLGWLKSISLMGNVWVAREAARLGCDEAVLIRGGDADGRGGVVSEGLATNIVLVFGRGPGAEVVTPSLESAPMLEGVTRDVLLKAAPHIVERTVRAEELSAASEVMLIGTTSYVSAVTSIDGRPVGDGRAGPVARELFERLLRWYLAGKDIEQG